MKDAVCAFEKKKTKRVQHTERPKRYANNKISVSDAIIIKSDN